MDYKSKYTKFVYMSEYAHDNEEIITKFNESIHRDIVPLYNGGNISGKTMFTAFNYYLSNDWDYFVNYMKEALK